MKIFGLKNVDPDYPFSYDFVDKEYKRSYNSYVKQKNLFSLLNVVVILIALFGLFALGFIFYRKTHERNRHSKNTGCRNEYFIKRTYLNNILFISIIGFLIALFPVYYLLNKWLENFAYRITISIYPFLIGFIALLS